MRHLLVFAAACCLVAAEKAPPSGEAVNKDAKIQATLHIDKQAIAKAVGDELPPGIVVVEVKMFPPAGGRLSINRDDFLLRSDRDGQRAMPYTPSQIAGSSVLVVRDSGSSSVATQSNGPIWGGLGGGAPRRMPGNGSAIGNTAGATAASADVQADGKAKADPLLPLLEQKILPEKDSSEPVSGQLYFLLEGKQKIKDIELLYRTSAGRLSVRFKLPDSK
jgi:hypothetical protein